MRATDNTYRVRKVCAARWLVGAALVVAELVARGALAHNRLETPLSRHRSGRASKIILISIDALRADRLGCYGYREAETSPTIDAWAAQALLFEHAFSQAPWTVPSMASLISGRYPAEVGAYENESGDIRSPDATLPEQLHRLGYRTAFFNTNPLLMRPGIARGFDTVGPPPDEFVAHAGPGHKVPYARVEPLVMRWLTQHARDKFFLWIHDMDTHSPPTEGNTYRGAPGWNDYDAEVRWVDEAVKRLFAKLDNLGIRNQVFLVFTADHGEAFGEHLLDGHQNVIYDEALRVPLIVQYPGMVRKGRVAASVALLDVNPTIAELAGAPMGRGESLVPLTATPATSVGHRYVFSSRYYFDDDRIDPATGKVLFARGQHHLAVHGRKWKLIARVQGTQGDNARKRPDWDTTNTASASYELYDLTADPLEQHDMFAVESKVAARLQQALAAWKLMINGEYPAKSGPVTVDAATHEAMHALGYDHN